MGRKEAMSVREERKECFKTLYACFVRVILKYLFKIVIPLLGVSIALYNLEFTRDEWHIRFDN